MLAGEDPDAARALAEGSANHFQRTRLRSPARRAPAAATAGTEEARPTSKPLVPQRAPKEPTERTYRHEGPTRSLVLNAFVHAFEAFGFVGENATVFDEHLLAVRLLDFSRPYWARILFARREAASALAVMTEVPPITNELGARFYLKRWAQVRGELGGIARAYFALRRQKGDPESDDLRMHCVMATFAARVLRCAEEAVGPYVREDVRAELRRLAVESSAAGRRPATRRFRAPRSAQGALPAVAQRKRG